MAYGECMRRVLVGDTEVHAVAVPRGPGFVSSVLIVRRCTGAAETHTRHEWDEPVFESEDEALRFAWRRAVVMVRYLTQRTSPSSRARLAGRRRSHPMPQP
ncbi:MAG TPA: hypothetical protein VMV45_05115 [Casimicrobiaceae bacterium]|nr:hypothetical protein [Casimicrobiaceae bacterium]